MTKSWTLAVARDELAHATVLDTPAPVIGPGQAVLRPDRVGLTANNVTYAVLGDLFRYWEFFPASHSGLGDEWGLVPVWGFADVVESTADGVDVGARVFGCLPPSGHLVVQPNRVDQRGFRDASEHRSPVRSPYNRYTLTAGDPMYDSRREDVLTLYRPLFYTSFMLADELTDNDFREAQTLVFSSASSKTAYGTAFLLRGKGPRIVGLTSPGNVDFTRGLGCYDEVLSYEDVTALDRTQTTGYLDVAGAADVQAQLRAHLGASLVFDTVVGISHQTPKAIGDGSTIFFAPKQIRKRTLDWGRDGLDAAFAEAWVPFASTVEGWVDVRTGTGPDALRDTWLEVLAGRTPPRVGHVITL